MKHLVLAFAIIAASSSVFAAGKEGWLVGVSYRDSQWSDDESPFSTHQSNMDVRIGYVMGNGIYLGAYYASQSSDNALLGGGGGMGASLGYSWNNWYANAHFLLSANRVNEDFDITDTGTGTDIEVGYMVPISGSFNLGISVMHAQRKYDKRDFAGVESDIDVKTIGTTWPNVTFVWMF
jgi:hypothetical protein